MNAERDPRTDRRKNGRSSFLRSIRGWSSRRWLAVVVVVAAVTAALVVDSRLDPLAVAEPPPARVPIESLVDRTSGGSVWYCPTVKVTAGPDEQGIDAEGELIVTNLGPEPAEVRVTALGASRSPDARVVQVDARGDIAIPAAELSDDEIVGAMVESNSASVVAWRRLLGSGGASEPGRDSVGCSDAPAAEWTAAAGSTAVDAREVLVLFNPFVEDRVVDLTVFTELEEGPFETPGLRGVVVPGRRVRAVEVGELVRRRDTVSLTVTSRSGGVVVDRLQSHDGSEGLISFSVSVPPRATSAGWHLAGVRADPSRTTRLVVANPGERTVEVDVTPYSGDQPGEPFQRTIAPSSFVTVDLAEAIVGIAEGSIFGLVVAASSGDPIAVDLAAYGEESGDMSVGVSTPRPRWVVPAAQSGATPSQLLMANPGIDAVGVDVVAYADGARTLVDRVELPPSGLELVDLSRVSSDRFAVDVAATAPILVATSRSADTPAADGLAWGLGLMGP